MQKSKQQNRRSPGYKHHQVTLPGCHVAMTLSLAYCQRNRLGTAGGGVMLLTPTDMPLMPFFTKLGIAARVMPTR